MALFDWFRKGQKTASVPQNNFIDHSLFVETKAPLQATPLPEELALPTPQRQSRLQQRPTAINDFLSRDYWQLGYDHSIQFPSNDRQQSALSRIRTDYRFALQQAEQALTTDIKTHEQEKTRLSGISDVVDSQMQLRENELQSLQALINRQLELSIDDEGWLAPVIAAYADGFVVGTMEYIRTGELLGGITALK